MRLGNNLIPDQVGKQRGFTIVELLIVIVIIGILAAITIVAYNGITERSKVQKANTDLNVLAKSIRVARLTQSKTLGQITGNYCTRCGTQATYEATLDKISVASGSDLSNLKAGDPWGSAYLIDENEGENGKCNKDTITVASSGSHSGLVIPVIPTFAC